MLKPGSFVYLLRKGQLYKRFLVGYNQLGQPVIEVDLGKGIAYMAVREKDLHSLNSTEILR